MSSGDSQEAVQGGEGEAPAEAHDSGSVLTDDFVDPTELQTVWNETIGANGWETADIPKTFSLKGNRGIRCTKFAQNKKAVTWQSDKGTALKEWKKLGQQPLYVGEPSPEIMLVGSAISINLACHSIVYCVRESEL